jgi:hypothetical protein
LLSEVSLASKPRISGVAISTERKLLQKWQTK